jgi:hypothetical protein
MKISYFILCIVVLFFGCTTEFTHTKGYCNYTMLTSKTYPTVLPTAIEIYLEKPPTIPYDKIAIISTNIPRENFATNIDYVKREAAQLGADAVVLISSTPWHGPGAFMMSGGVALAGGGASGYQYSFYAIKFIK